MKGYRSEALFGDGITDPLKVAYHETATLGNPDIPDWLIKHDAKLSAEEEEFLDSITAIENDKEYFFDILRNYLDGRNFCKWLCDKPEDIYHSYIEPFESNSISLDEFLNSGDIDCYNVPDSAVKLADLGVEGSLWCWKK